MANDITVVIPSIPTRSMMMLRAMRSVAVQSHPASTVLVEFDHDREGPAAMRNRALQKVTTEWVAFLDDDDQFNVNHLEAVHGCAEKTGADLVYPWFDVISTRATPGWDPLGCFGMPFDPERLDTANYIPVTVLARTKVIRDAGGFVNRSDGDATCEDWGCWLRMRDAGAKFVHHPERTWVWNWHNGNTSGRTDRW